MANTYNDQPIKDRPFEEICLSAGVPLPKEGKNILETLDNIHEAMESVAAYYNAKQLYPGITASRVNANVIYSTYGSILSIWDVPLQRFVIAGMPSIMSSTHDLSDVVSVNGLTGNVIITPESIGAVPGDAITNVINSVLNLRRFVTSVNNKHGDVKISANSLGALLADDAAAYYAPLHGPTFTDDTDVKGTMTADSFELTDDIKCGLAIEGGTDCTRVIPKVDGTKIIEKALTFNETTQEWEIEGTPIALKTDIPTCLPVCPDSHTLTMSGFFGDDLNQPIVFTNTVTGKLLTLTKSVPRQQYVYIAVSQEEAPHIKGISIEDGLPALWDSVHISINDKTYRVYKSPYKFSLSPLTFAMKRN